MFYIKLEPFKGFFFHDKCYCIQKVMLFYMLEQERSIKLLDPLLYWFAVLLQWTDCLLVLSDSSYLHQIIVVSQCNRI